MKRLLCVALVGVVFGVRAAPGIDVVTCGPAPASLAAGAQVPRTLPDGSAGVQQVVHLTLVNDGATGDTPISGGIEAGMAVGSAVFLVLAIAFGMRALRRFVDSASES